MNSLTIAAASVATESGLPSARLGPRFGRLDLQSQLALLAVSELKVDFTAFPPDRIGICLATSAGSLATDFNFWKGRHNPGGPSPTLFAYTLPSAAAGEIAIHFRLTGPNLCFVGDDRVPLPEGAAMIRRGEADGCVCVFCEVATADCAPVIPGPPVATACAIFLKRGGNGLRELREIDRDMKPLCTLISQINSAG